MNEEVFRALIKFAVKEARKITNDEEALEVKCLYKQWDMQIGNRLEVGEYIQHNNKLYRVLQAHTVQSNWEPGVGTEAIYIVIDLDHQGTLEDPIPYTANMEVFNGEYYTEDGILYLCIRDSGIALQNKASELVDSYFSIVNNQVDETPIEPDNSDSIDVPNKDESNGDNTQEGENTEVEEPTSSEEGTFDNPIDVTNATLPVTYELGKYYKENESIYKCIRTETLYYLPSALVGIYFELI